MDRRIKIGFVVVVVAAAVAVWLSQRSSPPLPGWETNLGAARRTAAAEGRRVLILFHSQPPSQTMHTLVDDVLETSHGRRAMLDGKFIRVHVVLGTPLKSNVARQYAIRKLPTMVILSPEGKELNRREGRVGLVEFGSQFLDCEKVIRPSGAGTQPASARGRT